MGSLAAAGARGVGERGTGNEMTVHLSRVWVENGGSVGDVDGLWSCPLLAQGTLGVAVWQGGWAVAWPAMPPPGTPGGGAGGKRVGGRAAAEELLALVQPHPRTHTEGSR